MSTYVVIIRREGKPERHIVLSSLSEALAVSRDDASWLRGIGSVLISMLGDYSAATPQKGL